MDTNVSLIDIRSESVRNWMIAAGQAAPSQPTMPDLETRKLRVKLIAEELLELCTAFGLRLEVDLTEDGYLCEVEEIGVEPDLVEAADALSDLDVVVTGSHVACGFSQHALLQENMASNHSKFVDGRPLLREDGKVLKGPNYRPPNFEEVLKAFGPPEVEYGQDEATDMALDREPETKPYVDPTPPDLPAEARIAEAHHKQSVALIGEAMAKLATLLAQGCREDNAMLRGEIAVKLRVAASRIQHGKPVPHEALEWGVDLPKSH